MAQSWQRICRLDALDIDRGVTALVRGHAIAIFRTHDDHVHALSNYDPFARASGLARGIVGQRGGIWFVASPQHRRAFDLASGACLDDSTTRVPVYEVRIVDGMVEVGDKVAS